MCFPRNGDASLSSAGTKKQWSQAGRGDYCLVPEGELHTWVEQVQLNRSMCVVATPQIITCAAFIHVQSPRAARTVSQPLHFIAFAGLAQTPACRVARRPSPARVFWLSNKDARHPRASPAARRERACQACDLWSKRQPAPIHLTTTTAPRLSSQPAIRSRHDL